MMQIASVLSDLTSLRVCDFPAAQALVSARPTTSSVEAVKERTAAALQQQQDEDPDLQRAKDVVDLHYGVKERYAGGVDDELAEARKKVEGIMRALEG